MQQALRTLKPNPKRRTVTFMFRRLNPLQLRREADPEPAAAAGRIRQQVQRRIRPAAHSPPPQPVPLQAKDEGL